MKKSAQHISVGVVVVAVVMLQLAQAQRPPYAGARPTGGLGQKDKYMRNPDGTQIASRFGGSDSNGTQQPVPRAPLPPPSHVAVVHPESAYAPLPAAPASDPQLSNRFGGSGATNANTNTNSIANANATPERLPLDAHGDRELINQLNRIPEHQRPFWFLNYQAIEAQRNSSVANSPGGIGARGSFFG